MDRDRLASNSGAGREFVRLQVFSTASVVSLILGLGLVSPAQAQTATSAETARPGSGFDEIIVTARRRDESISRTPMSIAALSSEELQQRQIQTETDIQRSVPGVVIRQGLTNNQLNYSIRGQTIDSYTSSPPGVLPYINEVQISNASANTFLDLESIQVLKGPQGTLFGRNTTGGAVLFETKKPGYELSGDFMARIGNYDDRHLQGALTVPIVSDMISLRVAGEYHERDGYVRNIYQGPGDFGRRDLGAIDTHTARATLLIEPSDRLKNIFMFQYTYTGGTNNGGSVYSVYGCGTPGLVSATDCIYNPNSPIPGVGALFTAYAKANNIFPGGLTAYLQRQKDRGPYEVEYNSPSWFRQKNSFITNTTTFEASDNLTVKNVFGWNRSNTIYSSDVDGTPYNIYNYGTLGATTGQPVKIRQVSDEFQIQGTAFQSRLDYIVGLYYSKQRTINNYRQCFFLLLGPTCNSLATNQSDTSKAIFAQATYAVTDQLKVTGGIRYTWEKIVSKQIEPQFAEPGDIPSNYDLFPDNRILTAKYDKPSWTVSLEYQATQELLLYATQRGSWRTGGINGFAFPVPGLTGAGGAEYLPETTKDVEVGAKYSGRLGGRPFRVSVAGYSQWINDVQRAVFVTLNGALAAVTASVPKAKVTGFEIDGQFSPADWFTVGGAVSYAKARFTSNVASFVSNGQLATTTFGPYPDTPRWSGSAFAEFKLPVGTDMGEVTLRGDYYGQSSTWFSSTGGSISPGTQLPAYKIANFRLNWADINHTGLSAAVFVNNAFKEKYYSGGLQTGTSLGLNTAIPGAPRMYGAELRFSF